MLSSTSSSTHHRRTVQKAAAAALLTIAFLCLIGSVMHATGANLLADRASNGNDSTESLLGLFSFTSSVLAMMIGRTLHSPARQIIYASGAMLILMAILFWFSVATNQ
jgi:putative Mn2+ efflux pump MntP